MQFSASPDTGQYGHCLFVCLFIGLTDGELPIQLAGRLVWVLVIVFAFHENNFFRRASG